MQFSLVDEAAFKLGKPPMAKATAPLQGNDGNQHARRSLRRIAVGLLGSGVTLVIHALLVGSLLGSFGRQKLKSPELPPDLTGEAGRGAHEARIQVVSLDGDGAAKSAAALPAPLVSLAQFRVSPPAQPHIRFPTDSEGRSPSPENASTGEDSSYSRLYGLYVGQIDARIERAWLRPRTSIGAPSFHCRVRIDQANDGAVKLVALEHCNGNERWRSSLVQAIRTASPLPAPPDPKVFVRALHITFEAGPYVEGVPGYQYEPETAATIAANDRERGAAAIERFNSALRSNGVGVIDLRIEGHPDTRQFPAVPSPGIGQGSTEPPIDSHNEEGLAPAPDH